MKAVYFFPGEGDFDALWTTHPLDARHRRWNSDPLSRPWVLDRMVEANVTTIVASYWGDMPQWSPMTLDGSSWRALVDAVGSRPLTVLPALESGSDPAHPEMPQWAFARDFPFSPGTTQLAPGLIHRIGQLVELFGGRRHLWTQLTDREGLPRYAINIIHAASDVIPPTSDPDALAAEAFDAVASAVQERFGITVGFTIDPAPTARHTFRPDTARGSLARASSVLAVQGFASEIFSGLVRNGRPCAAPDWRDCSPHDNNRDTLAQLVGWKRRIADAWVDAGIPVIVDVSNGFDGRIVWRLNGTGFWGDNLDYTEDRWRNWVSQLKGPRVSGITVDTWNGYTEGYSTVPSVEHGATVYNWLRDLLAPDPREHHHVHYVDGAATHRVTGPICEKWVALGADRGFGAPLDDEERLARGHRQFFADGKAIYSGVTSGTHELHGLIAVKYHEIGADGSALGLPISDEEPHGFGRVSRFEHGAITWLPGAPSAEVVVQ